MSVEEHLPYIPATIDEVEGVKAELDARFRQLIAEAEAEARAQGVELHPRLRQAHRVDTLLQVAREERCDLMVLGHGRRAGRIGSVALSVARAAPCSILCARGEPGLGRILVGLDGSVLGGQAFQVALELARLGGGHLDALTVHEVSPLEALDEAHAVRLGTAARLQAEAAGVSLEHFTVRGHAARSLGEEAARRGADLLVVGATGLEHPWSPTLGGTALRLLAEAPCSVLLVRPAQAVLHVEDIMARHLTTATPDTPLDRVFELLLRRDVKTLPVVDSEGRVAGIITGGDLLTRAHLDLPLNLQRELEPAALQERLARLREKGLRARDVMTSRVHTVPVGTDLPSAIALLARHGVKRLPVVDPQGRLVGLVSRVDILRALAACPEETAPPALAAPALVRCVGDLVVRDIPRVGPEASAEEVLACLVQHPLRRVLVVDSEGRLAGLINDRDLLVRAGAGHRPWLLSLLRALRGRAEPVPRPAGAVRAATLMTPGVVTVGPEAPLSQAIRLMVHHRVRSLPVVDEQGRPLGLVDRRDILRALAGARAG